MHAIRPCTGGCGRSTREGRCADCRREAEVRRGSAAERGYDARWRHRRRRYLRTHPMCETLVDGRLCSRRATDLDHDQPLAWGGADDESNWIPRCHSHHSAKTAAQTPGGWAQR